MPMPAKTAGTVVGRLTVITDYVRGSGRVHARCACGAETLVSRGNWGNTQSCGCLQRETVSAQMRTHGQSRSPGYDAWCGMIARCENTSHEAYANYGGRGITVCERWRHDYAAFRADMGERPDGMSLDRIDNDGNYEPSNCKWSTRREQNLNSRRSIAKQSSANG